MGKGKGKEKKLENEKESKSSEKPEDANCQKSKAQAEEEEDYSYDDDDHLEPASSPSHANEDEQSRATAAEAPTEKLAAALHIDDSHLHRRLDLLDETQQQNAHAHGASSNAFRVIRPHPDQHSNTRPIRLIDFSVLLDPPSSAVIIKPCGMSPKDGQPDQLAAAETQETTTLPIGLHYQQYNTKAHEEKYLPAIRQLISKDLSEPYSIYVYRYFLYQWADLCFMALDKAADLVGVIICKLEPHRAGPLRGYIAMLAVRQEHRGQGIAKSLVRMAIEKMIERDADEIALETEITNTPSLRLYESLGFLRSKRLHRYYLNGNAAFRLVLYLREGVASMPTKAPVYPTQGEHDASHDQTLNGR